MTELEFAEKIHALNGTAYLVGGAVRDKIRGVPAHDRDYCVTGVAEKNFVATFPHAEKFGKSFPVYSVDIDGAFCEVAFARTERKIGTGYRGFEILFAPDVTIEQDLFRRDTTINAMAIELLSGKLVDPFGGRADVLAKKIRAVSEHFTDDPVRALRAARQAAQFGFDICADTVAAMRCCGAELAHEPSERIFDELKTALKTDKPSIFFDSLNRADLLKIIFPEIANLRGKTYDNTLQILDAVAAVNTKPIVRFAALVRDLGGLEVLSRMDRRMTLPTDWKKSAAFVLREHMHAPRLKDPAKIVDLLLSLSGLKISVQDFCDIIRAETGNLPHYLEHAQEIIDALKKIGGKDAPPELRGKDIGKWIRAAQVRRFVELYSKEV